MVAQWLIEEALELRLHVQDLIADYKARNSAPGGRQLTIAEQVQRDLAGAPA